MPTIEECRKHPHKLDQHSGCCGFAAALMHLFVTKNKALNDFLNCMLSCKAYRGINKSTVITNRLIKRDLAGIIDIDAREDWMLCHGLMLLLKESSKQNGDDDWKKCEDYSKLWTGWTHGELTTDSVLQKPAEKLKDLIQANAKVNAEFQGKLSYKRGDMAVPADVLRNLLKLVDINIAGAMPIDSNEFSKFNGKRAWQVQSNNAFTKFTEEVGDVQRSGSTSSVRWSGLILGVGNKPGNQDFEKYYNVTHWVYVPAKPVSTPNSDDFKIWTWGKELDFWGQLVEDAKYYPALVIDLAKPPKP